MKRIGRGNRISKVPAAALALVLLWGPSAAAPANADCLLPYVQCVENASDLDSFLGRSFAGLRCFAELIHCLQRRLA
jgi:hypothetical protein